MKIWCFETSPLIDYFVTIILFVVFCTAIVWFFRNEKARRFENARTLLGVRLAILFFVAIAMLEPRWTEYFVPMRSVLFLVDDSPSMNLPASGENVEQSALAEAQKAAALASKLLNSTGDSQEYPTTILQAETRFLSEIVPQEKLESPLGDALMRLRDDPTAPFGVVLISDGIETGDVPLETGVGSLLRRDVVFFPVATGADSPWSELNLAILSHPETVFPEEELRVEILVSSKRYSGDVEISLKKSDSLTPLATTHATFSGKENETRRATLSFTPRDSGFVSFDVEARAVSQDSTSNAVQKDATKMAGAGLLLKKQRSFSIQIVSRKLRLLLASEKPTWEFRYLRNLFRREPSVELRTLVDSSLTSFQGENTLQSFPSAEELREYDAILLCDVSPKLLGAEGERALNDFVRHTYFSRVEPHEESKPVSDGRKLLIFVAGFRFQREAWSEMGLGGLLPFNRGEATWVENQTDAPAKFLPSALGKAIPPLGREAFPLVYSWLKIDSAANDFQIFANFERNHEATPALLLKNFENGAFLFCAFDSSWRFRDLEGGNAYRVYWTQILHYFHTLASREKSHGDEDSASVPQVGESEIDPRVVASEKEFSQTNANRAKLNETASIAGTTLFETNEMEQLVEELRILSQNKPVEILPTGRSVPLVAQSILLLVIVSLGAFLWATMRRNAF
ncbi:MAG: cbb3-type cytochrome c oxidase subunit 3 [Planctomycetia bacterium]|nr:cbb3-type cytochrome c oxidase subunit 3 [Planctomycetia bacterium]